MAAHLCFIIVCSRFSSLLDYFPGGFHCRQLFDLMSRRARPAALGFLNEISQEKSKETAQSQGGTAEQLEKEHGKEKSHHFFPSHASFWVRCFVSGF